MVDELATVAAKELLDSGSVLADCHNLARLELLPICASVALWPSDCEPDTYWTASKTQAGGVATTI